MENKLVAKTVEAFKKQFGEEPEGVFMSPGRINVIGEHIDYNDGFVLPAAIDKYFCFAIKKTDARTGEFFSVDYNEKYTCNIDDELKPVSVAWANYMLGVINEIKKRGKKISGFKVTLSSDVPIGAGLSSSAALECGFGFAINTINNLGIDRREISLIGQASEHTFAGVNCGIMDQFASVFGQKEKVIKLDCVSLEYNLYDAKLGDYCFVLFDTCVKHNLASSGYNERRSQVEKGKSMIMAKYPEVKSFRDVTHEMLDSLKEELGEVVYRRCRFVIEEIKRVGEAATALQNQDIKKLGELLKATHHGLSMEYEVSCEELDFLVDNVLKEEGAVGARMMGGGFGGCTINLVKKSEAEHIIATIQKKYKEKFGIDMKVYQVNISEGSHQHKM